MNFLWTHPLAPSLRGCGPNCFHPFSFFIFIRTLGEREGGNDWEEHLHSVEVQAKTQNTNDAKWTAKFNKLVAFKAVHNNLKIPQDHELYIWTYNQRSAKNNPKSKLKLNDERIGLLDGLGFEW